MSPGSPFFSNAIDIEPYLAKIPAVDIWGIGSRNARKLLQYGIKTALDFRDAEEAFIQKHFSICGLQTLYELRGISCIALEDAPPERKSICTSKMFGRKIETLEELREAIATYTARAAERLRQERLAANVFTIFIQTNLFEEPGKRYCNSHTVTLPVATDNTGTMIHLALSGLKRIFREGYMYQKAGILLNGLQPVGQVQPDLFTPGTSIRAANLTKTIDEINRKYGARTIFHAVEGAKHSWEMRRAHCSLHYTTSWRDLLSVG